ncbi:hypothetical protein TOTORO_01510 [Serratia phage vB_SmaS-Totoro]|nr:hypothetical protein TOTORO_01510 [Serratia phage vB_SmaS-Totoro]
MTTPESRKEALKHFIQSPATAEAIAYFRRDEDRKVSKFIETVMCDVERAMGVMFTDLASITATACLADKWAVHSSKSGESYFSYKAEVADYVVIGTIEVNSAVTFRIKYSEKDYERISGGVCRCAILRTDAIKEIEALLTLHYPDIAVMVDTPSIDFTNEAMNKTIRQ